MDNVITEEKAYTFVTHDGKSSLALTPSQYFHIPIAFFFNSVKLFLYFKKTMPSVLIKTNVPLDDEAKVNMMKEASKAVAENTGKPESFVLVSVDQCAMIFGGSADPCAYIVSIGQLKSIERGNIFSYPYEWLTLTSFGLLTW